MNYELLVVIDPTQEEQPALERAAMLSYIASNVSLHIVLCDYPSEDFLEDHSIREAKRLFLKEKEDYLKKLIKDYNCDPKKSTTEVYWNQEWHESVLQVANKRQSALIVKSTKHHSKLERLLKKTSDLMLIRESQCPVLLVNETISWGSEPCMLAALDLESETPEHTALNNSIIDAIQIFADSFDINPHVVAAQQDELDPENKEAIKSELSSQIDIENVRIHLQQGSPSKVIKQVLHETQAGLLIIGSVARKGLKATVFGNTAEKILDDVRTDILIVNL